MAALKSGWVSTAGPAIEALEAWAHSYTGMHAVALSSGTAAIDLAMHMLQADAQTEVFVPGFTFAASAFPAWHRGAKICFIDVSPDNWCMAPSLLEEALVTSTAEKKIVIAVDAYGTPADYAALKALQVLYGFELIADAAESVGALYNGRPSGISARFMVWSFNGNKLVTSGGGGMLLCQHPLDAEMARHLATQAREPKVYYHHEQAGFNYRLSNVSAALALSQLKRLPQLVQTHAEGVEAYKELMEEQMELAAWQPALPGSMPNYWLACVAFPDAQPFIKQMIMLIDELGAVGIEARPLWKPLQSQPVFFSTNRSRYVGRADDEYLFNTGLCLPNGAHVRAATRQQAVGIICQWLQRVAK